MKKIEKERRETARKGRDSTFVLRKVGIWMNI